MYKQTITIEAGFSYGSAREFIKFLVEEGFSVTAKASENVWKIEAVKESSEITSPLSIWSPTISPNTEGTIV